MRFSILLIALAAMPALAVPVTKAPYRGVMMTHEVRSAPRLIAIHTVVVDLTEPGVSVAVTPSNGAAANETNLQTTLNFLTASGAQIATNAHFFAPVSSEGTPADVLGLAVSNGEVYSPQQAGFPAFVIRAGNVPGVLDPAEPVPADVQQAVAGDWRIVTAGVNTGIDSSSHHSQLHPRTAIGHSADGSRLILMTVDGRQTAQSEGVTTGELGALMIEAGAWQALNLDGGGSTTLAMSLPTPHVVNVPAPDTASPGVQRSNGSSIAIFAPAKPDPTATQMIAADEFDYPHRDAGTDSNLKPNGGGVRNLWGGGGWLGPWRDGYGETRFNGIAGPTEYSAAATGSRLGPLAYSDAAGLKLHVSGAVLRGSFGLSATSLRHLDMNQVDAALLRGGSLGADGAVVWISFLTQSHSSNGGDRYSYMEFGSGFQLGRFVNQTNWAARASPSGTITASSVPTGNVALYLAKIEFKTGADTVKVWINPPLGGEHLLGTPLSLSVPDFTFNTVYFRNRYSTDLDELRIGTSYAAVTPVLIAADSLRLTGSVLQWTSVPDKLYQLWHASDLMTWTPMAALVASQGGVTSAPAQMQAGAALGFWKVGVPPARER